MVISRPIPSARAASVSLGMVVARVYLPHALVCPRARGGGGGLQERIYLPWRTT